MPRSKFEVESYTVTADPRGYATYQLFVTSPAMYHGIRTRAFINFYPTDKVPSNQGWATNVGGVNFDGITVRGYADEKHFEAMHHVLQTEEPVSFEFGYHSGSSTTRKLYDFKLTTSDEPTGEGMADAGAGLMALVASGELDLDEADPTDLGVENFEALRPTEEFAEEIQAAQ